MSLRNFLDRALKREAAQKAHFGTGGDDHDLLPRLRMEREVQRRAEAQAAEFKKQEDAVLTKNSDLEDRFLEIAERKVSVLDDYGDENWEALPEEVDKCLVKIAKRDPSIDVSRIGAKSPLTPDLKKLLGGYNEPTARYMAASLESRFRAYHDARKKSSSAAQDISALSGTEFETYLAKLLKEAGFESVVGTPASGDQGADLIARRNGRVIAIQAKGYRGTVGNGAVQEIVGALRFYGADEGWVITNSTFTASARALAQANNIRLIDGNDLKDIAALRAKL
jgi:restriction endonuclease Mrr